MQTPVYTLDEIKAKLVPVFEKAPVYRAVLFGSYAKGLATASSDIDIVIDSNRQLLNIYFYGVLEDLTQALGKQIDLFEISEIRTESLIYKRIQQEGILLYERERQNNIPEGYQLYQ